jgi:hypothetical protein
MARDPLISIRRRWCRNCGGRLWIASRLCWWCKWMRQVGEDGW